LNDLKKKNDTEVVDQLNLIETYIQGDLGVFYAESGDPDTGQRLLKSAISRLEPIMDYEGISEFQLALGEILISEGQFDEASMLVNSSLEHATKQQRKKIIGKANGLLADLAEIEGDTEKALNHRNISNSINEELQQMRQQSRQHIYSLAQQQFDSENEILRGEQKIDRQRTMIILTAAVLLLLALLAVGLFGRYRYIRNTNRIISEEKKRSDGLLLNILPKDTAAELISHGHVKAKKYNSVTVMFTDFLGFTRYADDLPPEELVKAVDYYFSRFDQIIERHGLEKIKTVGDAYLCAGGLPDPSIDHPERIIRAAFDIIDLVKKAKYDENDLTRFDVRIGISTGPVVAGVVGSMKFAYDIWGDTVNCASRMETNSEPMRINVSQYTFELVKDKFDFTPRGEIEVKNKGKMRMYFAEPPESKDSKRAFQGDASLIV
ncbi:MAG: adenylate/guanylate cyclase domain-containing protein, partial [Bacteroidia bacterium]|nr:adenylate/guanylate cyclase domain-containing protein [Bacteroidia bacterium]